MLARKQRIEDLKEKQRMREILFALKIEDFFSSNNFTTTNLATSLMQNAFEKSIFHEIGRFNLPNRNLNKKITSKALTSEEKKTLTDNFISQNNHEKLILLSWRTRVFGLTFCSRNIDCLRVALENIEGDIVLISENADHGFCLLEEENFLRLSEW